jgi:polyphosphate kinase 2 (PPK2 family)
MLRAPEQVLEAAPSQPTPPNERLAQIAATAPFALDKDAYKDELAQLQGRLNHLHREARARGVALIGVFEGRDAAGKGGAIRRIVPAFDARCIDVVRTGPPSEDERAHHYLWRFWRRVPRAGHATLFDRSWYGRVLVERVEELVDARALERAYGEINEFELQLVEHGIVLVKFWLEISRKEQERRFDERERVAHKRWKFTEDDARNRGLWNEYDSAIADMLNRTDTQHAA